jgi:hypothetical protein
MRSLVKFTGMILTLALVFGMPMMIGCSDDDDNGGTEPDPPVCTVTPGALSFGQIEVGTSSTLTFTISNVGGGTLTGAVAASLSGFTITSGAGSYSLSKGQNHNVNVAFQPAAEQSYSGTISTGSSCSSVSVSGTGTGGVQTTGTISGTVTLPPGMNGDLRNARVALFQSVGDLQNDLVFRSVAAQGIESQVTFTIDNLPPGLIYCDFWKDVNNNALFDTGDFYGVHGTINWPNINPAPIAVVVGQTSLANIILIAIP